MAKTSNKGASAAASKPRALALHIGLNLVDPKHYAGWSGPLAACEFDANDMASIAERQGMASALLLTVLMLINPDYMRHLFDPGLPRLLAAIAALMVLTGNLVLRRVLAIDI